MALKPENIHLKKRNPRGIPDDYTYFHPTDTIADITASGYFSGYSFTNDNPRFTGFDLPDTEAVAIQVQCAGGPYEVQLVGGVASVVGDGPLSKPDGFDWSYSVLPLPVKIGNSYDCSVKPSDLIDSSSWNVIYVDGENGSDGNNGSTWALAKASIGSAISQANLNGTDTKVKIRGGLYTRFKGFHPSNVRFSLSVNISFEAVYGRVETGPFETLTWSQNGTYSTVYETSRSAAQQVFNTQLRDSSGEYLRYTHVADLATCAANAGTWYTDNVTTYVHTHNQAPANDSNARVYLATRCCDFDANNNDVYFYGIDFTGGSTGCITPTGGTTNKVVMEDCTLKFALNGTRSAGVTAIDCAQILDCGLFAAYNCQASYGSKDGFNLHESASVKPHGLFVNCSGYQNGKLVNTSQSNNGLTAHDGIKVIDIGGEWLGSVGTNSGHVNDDTQVWSIGCIAGQSDGDVVNGGSVTWGAFGMWSGIGQMWLDSCKDVGSDIGLYAANDSTIYIRNHTGNGRRIGDVQEY